MGAVIYYYASWATYRSYNGKCRIEDLDLAPATHLIYAFVGLNHDDTIKYTDQHLQPSDFHKLFDLKKKYPKLKIMVSMGGASEGSSKFSEMAKYENKRKNFVKNVLKMLQDFNLDGFDLDWEFPSENDRNNLNLLLSELSSKLHFHGKLLSIAVAGSYKFHSERYDAPEICKYVDFINLMTYDFYSPSEPYTRHHSALYKSKYDKSVDYNVSSAVESWITAKASPRKLILGIPLYGRTFSLKSSQYTDIGSPAYFPGPSGPYTKEPGVLSNLEIREKISSGGWTTKYDSNTKTPYSYKGTEWIGYENRNSISEKFAFANEKQLGGCMFWTIDFDNQYRHN